MTPERFARLQRVLQRRQPDLTVITDEVHKLRNISAIMRTCDAVGIDTMHIVQPKAGFRVYRGTTQSSDKWVAVEPHDDVQSAISQAKSKGFQIVGANLSKKAIDYTQVDYTQGTALLLGTESQGVSETALSLLDHEVVIPMEGMVASFNVSVAAAIILNEAHRQRLLAGCYDRQKLPDALYKKRFFCWAYPKLADYCHQHNLDYPEVDEQGELKDGPQWYAQVKEARKTEDDE